MTKYIVMEGGARSRNLGMPNADIVCGVLENHTAANRSQGQSPPTGTRGYEGTWGT